MQVNRLQQWLSPFKATVEGQSLCALEQRPEILPAAQLCINSKQLKEGDIFLALPGITCHGNQFIGAALQQGAALVLTDELLPAQSHLVHDPRILLWPDLAAVLAAVVSSFYLEAASQLKLVGITGTNG
ncbi:MAG: hypothetical protein KKB45_05195, partial [Gammaproteobacteria bacterium]|nr:hypothetical protein [Gammaproteobacteria bacterium]